MVALNMRSQRHSLLLISFSFIMWGILRSLDDVLLALFQAAGSLHYATAMLVHSSFFSAYLLVPLPAAIILRRTGYRLTLVYSTVLMGTGAVICVFAVLWDAFPLCLSGIFVAAAGIAALQTSANPCIGLLGTPSGATQRLLFVQGFSSFGSILGPLMGAWLFSKAANPGASGITFPSRELGIIYGSIAALLIVLAVVLYVSFTNALEPDVVADGSSSMSQLRSRHLRFGLIAVFLYVGTEATLLGHAILYMSFPGNRIFHASFAALLLSFYWAAVVLGRITSVAFLSKMSARRILCVSAAAAFALLQVALFSHGIGGALCLLATGLFNSTIFPTVFSLSVADLRERDLPLASALLTSAMCGGAVIPFASGSLADHFGLAAAFILPSMTYALIAVCAPQWFQVNYRLRTSMAGR